MKTARAERAGYWDAESAAKRMDALEVEVAMLRAELAKWTTQPTAMWIDPADLPLPNSAAMIYATNDNFDGNTVPLIRQIQVKSFASIKRCD